MDDLPDYEEYQRFRAGPQSADWQKAGQFMDALADVPVEAQKLNVIAPLPSARQAVDPVGMTACVTAKSAAKLAEAVNQRLLDLLDAGAWLFWWEVVYPLPRYDPKMEALTLSARVQRKAALWLCDDCALGARRLGVDEQISADLPQGKLARCDDCRAERYLAHWDVRRHPRATPLFEPSQRRVYVKPESIEIREMGPIEPER